MAGSEQFFIVLCILIVVGVMATYASTRRFRGKQDEARHADVTREQASARQLQPRGANAQREISLRNPPASQPTQTPLIWNDQSDPLLRHRETLLTSRDQ